MHANVAWKKENIMPLLLILFYCFNFFFLETTIQQNVCNNFRKVDLTCDVKSSFTRPFMAFKEEGEFFMGLFLIRYITVRLNNCVNKFS